MLLVFLFPSTSSPAEEMWLVWSDYQQARNPVYYSHFRNGNWDTKLFEESMEFAQNYMPCLGIDESGKPWLVWAAQKDRNNARIYYSRLEAGSWSQPEPAGRVPGRWESNPVITFDLEGRAWLAWSGVAGKSSEVFCARWANGQFGLETMVSTPDDSPDTNPVIAINTDRNPIVVWQGWDGHHAQIFQSRFLSSRWSEEEVIKPISGVDRVLPSMTISRRGQLEFYWETAGALFRLNPRVQSVEQMNFPLKKIPQTPFPPPTLGENDAWLILCDEMGRWTCYRYSEINATGVSKQQVKTTGIALTGVSGGDEYIGYGDSITYGVADGADDQGWYGSLLKTMLEKAYPGHTYHPINDGYPGATTGQLLYGKPYSPIHGIDHDLRKYSPGKILIMAGTNDIDKGVSLEDIKWNLGEMIDRARNYSFEPLIATIIPRWDTSTYLSLSDSLNNNYIIPLAQEKNALLANPWQVYIDYGDYQTLYASDRVHPRWPEGFQKIADAWFAVFPPPGPLEGILKWARDWASGL